MQTLKDKVIIITGAGDGLGRALSLNLAEKGAVLALISKSEEKLISLSKEINKSKYFVCDVSSSEQVEKTVSEVVNHFGTIDVLINNAGVWFEGKTIDHTKEKVHELFSTNIEGTIFMTQEVLKTMKQHNSGQILNVSSTAGIEPSGGWGVYSSTKYAVKGFTDSLKLELDSSGIRVMGFYPGGMNTNIFNSSGFKKANEPWMMKVEDVSEIISFMLSQPDDITIHHLEVKKQM